MEKKSDNEVIAEFVEGITFDKDGFCTDQSQKYSWRPGCYSPLHIEHLNYHASWDWFMPAYRKFSDLLFDDDKQSLRHSDLCASIAEEVLEIDILGANEQLVKGINWYNTTTKEGELKK